MVGRPSRALATAIEAVFDNHEIGVGKGGPNVSSEAVDFCGSGRSHPMEPGSAIGPASNRKVRNLDIDLPFSGNRANLESETMQRVDPCIGHDGDSIGSSEPERKHCARGH